MYTIFLGSVRLNLIFYKLMQGCALNKTDQKLIDRLSFKQDNPYEESV